MGLLETLDFRGRGDTANGRHSLDSDIARDNYYIPIEVIGCDLADAYELYNWRRFVSDFGYYREKEVVTWEKVATCYYKAYLKNGNIIFYDRDDRFYRELTEEEARFNNEEEWCREFSRRLIRIMNIRGFNQYDLARLTGCSQSSISHYITGKRIPSAFAVNTIAKACECSVEYLTRF